MVVERSYCTGCGICYAICPVAAIEMVDDEVTGFPYPVVSELKCIACGRCERVCPELRPVRKGDQGFHQKGYAAIASSEDDEIRLSSTSGGVFSLLAREVMESGGAVCGAIYDKNLDVVHKAVESESELPQLRRSKYLQSRVWPIYHNIRNIAESGREVLFSGTPCQVGAMVRFAEEYGFLEQMFMVEVLCRGVPSPKAFHRYIRELEAEQGKKIIKVDFKVKDRGWHSLGTKYTFQDGSELVEDKLENDFLLSFVDCDYCIRENCFRCQYKDINRAADITLGDYWGLLDLEMEDDKGTSAVLVNTLKGQEHYDRIMPFLRMKESSPEDIKKGNRLAFMDLQDNRDGGRRFWELLSKVSYRDANRLVRCE